MDIAYFISDLLGQQGKVTVPNLGYFAQVRVPAFYDNRLKQYLPPHNSVKFDPNVISDDELLASHISSTKKISQSSAKYFIEKFIINLKSQAVVEKIELANLGTFSSDGVNLNFTPIANNDDPSFFACPPVEAYRLGDTQKKAGNLNEMPAIPVVQHPVATIIIEQPEIQPDTKPVNSVKDDESEELIYEDEPRGIATWVIVTGAVAVLLIALFSLYEYKPDLFQQFYPANNNAADSTPPVVKKDTGASRTITVKQDSITKPDSTTVVTTLPENKLPQEAVKTDKLQAKTAEQLNTVPVTPEQTATDMPEVITKGTWVIYSQVFPTRRGADRRIAYLKAKGFVQARLANANVNRGGNYKVILGAFKSRAEAMDTQKQILATGKITEADLYVERY